MFTEVLVIVLIIMEDGASVLDGATLIMDMAGDTHITLTDGAILIMAGDILLTDTVAVMVTHITEEEEAPRTTTEGTHLQEAIILEEEVTIAQVEKTINTATEEGALILEANQ